jgi:hypothetical protein
MKGDRPVWVIEREQTRCEEPGRAATDDLNASGLH